jgi:hypothetical protein
LNPTTLTFISFVIEFITPFTFPLQTVFTEHVNYCVENYPKEEGVTTYFITGNHDLDYMKVAGVDVGKLISASRPDLKYLGQYDATIRLNGIYIGLHHGGGGASYAQSYKLQKYVERIGAGQKPQIYVLGH